MSLKVFNDLADNASVACIPESGNFKAAGNNYFSKRDPFSYETDRLIIADGCGFDIFNGEAWRQVVNRGEIDVLATSLLDTGAFAVGTDYYLYLCIDANDNPLFSISANATFPAGYAAHNSRKVGGFHFGHIRCVASDGSWAPIDSNGVKFGATGTKWENNIVTGIIPNSVWDLKNRPQCAPEGMVKVGKKWVDIYLSSAAEPIESEGSSGSHVKRGKLQSKYGQLPATGTEGLNWYGFSELAALCGKELLSYADWCAAARGNPQGEDGADNYGWTKTSNGSRARTGCRVNASTGLFDPAGIKPYAISAFNCVDCVGNVYEWLDELVSRTASNPAWAWQDVLGAGKGKAYMESSNQLVALRAGGNWYEGANCGSRCVNLYYSPWNVDSINGVRLACDAA